MENIYDRTHDSPSESNLHVIATWSNVTGKYNMEVLEHIKKYKNFVTRLNFVMFCYGFLHAVFTNIQQVYITVEVGNCTILAK